MTARTESNIIVPIVADEVINLYYIQNCTLNVISKEATENY